MKIFSILLEFVFCILAIYFDIDPKDAMERICFNRAPKFYEAGMDTETSGGTQGTADMAGYFDQVRLNRRQARDEATATLSTISETAGASQEAIDAALAQMMQLAGWTAQEAELESLITAKGFENCVVFIAEDGVTVTVSVDVEGLSTAGAAKIADIVTAETGCAASDIKIIEIK